MKNEKNVGTVDLGLKDNVKRIEPREEKDIEDYDVADYARLMNGDDYHNNNVVDLEID
jgi:hypothetical protein